MDEVRNTASRAHGARAGRVTIVGGGMAGLAAAIYAARAGAHVTLLEGAQKLGGRAQTSLDQGFSVNMGPHALYRNGAAMATLNDLGINPPGGLPTISGNTAYHGGTMHKLPVSLMTILQSSLLPLKDKWATLQFYKALGKLDSRLYDHVSVADALKRLVPAARAQEFIAAIIRLGTYTNAPALLSAGAAFEQMQMAFGGVLYVDGGWQTLVSALEEKARAAGVDIRLGAKVRDISRSGPTLEIALAGGETTTTDACILAVAPAAAAGIAGSLMPVLMDQAATAIPVRAACLDVGIASVPRPEANFALGIDEPLYFSLHSKVAKVAPDGQGMIHAAIYLDPHKSADDSESRLERFSSLVQPGWEGHERIRHFRPGMTVSNWLPLASQDGLKGRPAVATADGGLFLAGDWVGSHGLLSDAAMASGREAGALAALAARLAMATA